MGSVNVSKSGLPPDTVEKAEDMLVAGASNLDHGLKDGAYWVMSALWTYPGTVLRSPGILPRALRLMADVCRAFDPDDPVTGAAEAAALDHNASQSLYSLGLCLMQQMQFSSACSTLLIAHEMNPDNGDVFVKLLEALAGAEQHEEVVRVVEATPNMLQNPKAQFILSFKAFSAIMAGNLEVARETTARMQELADRTDALDFNIASMERKLSRADSLKGISPLDNRDLRGWHYVLNGGLLLHMSPYGLDAMNGRYCWVHDSAARCHEGIQKLKAALGAEEIVPARVFTLPDQKSSILAHALATALGCETTPWPEGGTSHQGIIVAYDLNLVEEGLLGYLFSRYPGQYLWAHAVCWTDPVPWMPVPDFVTFLYQTLVSPWAEGLPGESRVQDTQPWEDETLIAANQEVLSARILNAELDNQLRPAMEDLPTLIEFAKSMKDDAAQGPLPSQAHRLMQLPRSPVLSNRF